MKIAWLCYIFGDKQGLFCFFYAFVYSRVVLPMTVEEVRADTTEITFWFLTQVYLWNLFQKLRNYIEFFVSLSVAIIAVWIFLQNKNLLKLFWVSHSHGNWLLYIIQFNDLNSFRSSCYQNKNTVTVSTFLGNFWL